MQGVHNALLKFNPFGVKHVVAAHRQHNKGMFLREIGVVSEGNFGRNLEQQKGTVRAGAAPGCTPTLLAPQREPAFWVVLCPLMQGWHELLNGTNTPTEQPSCVAVPPQASTPERGTAPRPDV